MTSHEIVEGLCTTDQPAPAGLRPNSASIAAMPAETPFWDAKLHTLTWRDQIVKHFKSEAPCQEAIAFQASGWESCITFETFEIDAAVTERLKLGHL